MLTNTFATHRIYEKTSQHRMNVDENPKLLKIWHSYDGFIIHQLLRIHHDMYYSNNRLTECCLLAQIVDSKIPILSPFPLSIMNRESSIFCIDILTYTQRSTLSLKQWIF